MDVFFSDEDRDKYLKHLAEQGERFGVEFLAWCLMTNHVHLVVVPDNTEALAKGIGEAHKRYSRMVNLREGWRGYLFQGRFFSCPIEPASLLAVVRYVLRNPVRAGMVRNAWDHPWSSARWLVGNAPFDPLVKKKGAMVEVDDWQSFLTSSDIEADEVRQHTRTGRPMGSDSFISQLEHLLKRSLQKKRPGPPSRS
jgi:putative transposase